MRLLSPFFFICFPSLLVIDIVGKCATSICLVFVPFIFRQEKVWPDQTPSIVNPFMGEWVSVCSRFELFKWNFKQMKSAAHCNGHKRWRHDSPQSESESESEAIEMRTGWQDSGNSRNNCHLLLSLSVTLLVCCTTSLYCTPNCSFYCWQCTGRNCGQRLQIQNRRKLSYKG